MIYYFAHFCMLTGLNSVVLPQWGHTGIGSVEAEPSHTSSRASFHMTFNHSVVWLGLLTTMSTGLQERAFQKDKPYCASTYQDSAYLTLINAHQPHGQVQIQHGRELHRGMNTGVMVTVHQSSVMQTETSLCYYKISSTNTLLTIYDHYRIMKHCLLWPNIITVQFNFPQSCRFIRYTSFKVKVLLYVLSLHIMVCHFSSL